jgi:hypothetical protein
MASYKPEFRLFSVAGRAKQDNPRPWSEEPQTERAKTDAFAKKLFTKTADIDKPVVTSPIVGATKPHHLEDAVAALSVILTPEEIARLEEPYQPHPPLKHSHRTLAG